MSHGTEVFNGDLMQHYSRVFRERGEIAADGVFFAAMVLDSLGTVRYCHDDAARLFRADAETLLGRHVKKLIPDLPFHPGTPGYNIAYATFWAAEGSRRGFYGVDSLGRSFGVQVALDSLKLEKHQQILLSLRSPFVSAPLPEARADSGEVLDAEAGRSEISTLPNTR